MFRDSKSIVAATITSVVPLTDDEKQRLVEKLEKTSGKKVAAKWEIDESILGGIVVEMDDKILDGSLKRRLHEVKEVMDK